MKSGIKMLVLVLGLLAVSCSGVQNKEIVNRDFYGNKWNRFDYIKATLDVVDVSTYQLVASVALADEYPDEFVSFNLTIFYPDEGGYRSNNYRYRVKNTSGEWMAEKTDGVYKFEFPINNKLEFNSKGSYEFMIENKYPKYDLEGICNLRVYLK